VLANGGFERLSGALSPVGFTLSGATLTRALVKDGVNAVAAPISGSGTVDAQVPVKAGAAYEITLFATGANAGDVTAALGTGSGAYTAALTATDRGDWKELRGVFRSAAGAEALPADAPSALALRLTLPAGVTADTIGLVPRSAGVTTRMTPLLLGTETKWEIDLVNNGSTPATVDPLASIASLSFRYGTAVWGGLRTCGSRSATRSATPPTPAAARSTSRAPTPAPARRTWP